MRRSNKCGCVRNNEIINLHLGSGAGIHPNKEGKIWCENMLCKSSTGYLYSFIIYTGSFADYGLCNHRFNSLSKIVLPLCQLLLNRDCYTSPELTYALLGLCL